MTKEDMKALEALKEIEWMDVDKWMDELCPVCKQIRSARHAQWCRLDRAIGFLEREHIEWPYQIHVRAKTYKELEDRVDFLMAAEGMEDMGFDPVKQPPDAPTPSPEAERPPTRPDVPPKAPEDTRQAWDKMDKATESSKITQDAREHVDNLHNREANLVRELCKYIDELDVEQPKAGELKEKLAKLAHEQWSGWIKYMFSKCHKDVHHATLIIPKWAVERWGHQAKTPYDNLSKEEKDSDRTEADKFLAVFHDTIDRLEREAKTTVGTNTRLKAECNKLKAQVKHTVDFCKVQIGISRISIPAAMAITGLSYKTVSDWPEIDTTDCKTFLEAIAKAEQVVKEQKEDKYYLPVQCPSGGEHKWKAVCSKCDMKIWHNNEKT